MGMNEFHELAHFVLKVRMFAEDPLHLLQRHTFLITATLKQDLSQIFLLPNVATDDGILLLLKRSRRFRWQELDWDLVRLVLAPLHQLSNVICQFLSRTARSNAFCSGPESGASNDESGREL